MTPRRPRLTGTSQGLLALAGMLVCVADLAEAAARYGRFFGFPPDAEGAAQVFAVPGGRFTLVDPAGLAGILPGITPPCLPWGAAVVLTCADLEATRRRLAGAGVGVTPQGGPWSCLRRRRAARRSCSRRTAHRARIPRRRPDIQYGVMNTTVDRQHEMRGRLESELRLTVARLRALGAQVSPEVSGVAGGDSPFDTFENAELHAARETLFASGERLGARAQQLVQAIERLEAGTYGTCVECGSPIGLARLRAIPEAATCVTCQERLDRGRPGGPARSPVAAERRPPAIRPADSHAAEEGAPPEGDVEDAPPVKRAAPPDRRRPSTHRGGRRAA